MSNELRLGAVTLRDRHGNIRLLDPRTEREIFEIEAADVDDIIKFLLSNKKRNAAMALHPAGKNIDAIMAHVRQEDTAFGQQR